jgi:hypothetical protein
MTDKIIKLLNNGSAPMKVHAKGVATDWKVGEILEVSAKEAEFLLTYEGIIEAGKAAINTGSAELLKKIALLEKENESLKEELAKSKEVKETKVKETKVKE